VQWTGATGAFAFRRAVDKSGAPAGYDAVQTPIVSVTRNGRYAIEK
jgi:branched-chain amino acid transport system substrate-binding protein